MKYFLLIIGFALFQQNAFSQINAEDSTVQVISYWEKGDIENYALTVKNIKLNGADTVSNEKIVYQIEIKVLDQTDSNYTIQWLYKEVQTDSKKPSLLHFLNSMANKRVIFKTDELGVFKELINWQELMDFNKKASQIFLDNKIQLEEEDFLLKQIVQINNSRESIEAMTIKEIQQFHSFHGAKFKLQEEYSSEIALPNFVGDDPLIANSKFILSEINQEENYYIVESSQIVNQSQLIQNTFKLLTKAAKEMNSEPPRIEDLHNLQNISLTYAKINNEGWVLYSQLKLLVTFENFSNIEERTIEHKEK